MQKMNEQELLDLLKKYEEAYYNEPDFLLQDAEYNALVERYLKLTKQTSYDFVPGEIKNGKRIKHPVPVLSLDKVKTSDQDLLKKELQRLWPVIIQWKLDGATLVFYQDFALSRGNGIYGEDKSACVPYIKNKGDMPSNPVRTEAVITKKSFELLNKKRIESGLKPFENARNALSGMLNRKIGPNNIPEGVSVIAYEIINSEENNFQTEQLAQLEELGWNVVPTYEPKTIEEAIDYINHFDIDAVNVDIDGLVVKHNGNKTFGVTGHHSKAAFAVKYPTPEIWTDLYGITWSVGSTGKVNPTARFKSVNILGSNVDAATLHNIAYIRALGIEKMNTPGNSHACSQVKITKANQIIPAVLEFREGALNGDIIEVIEPALCPCCASKLIKKEDQLFCTNIRCKDRLIAQAVNAVSREGLDIEDLSEETIKKMYDLMSDIIASSNDKTPISSLTFCLNWSKSMLLLLEGFAEKSASNLCNQYEEKLKAPAFSRVLYASNIPLIGKSTAKLIAQNFKSYEELRDDLFTNEGKKFQSIKGIGKEAYSCITIYFGNLCQLVNELKGITYEYTDASTKPEKQLTFVITGELSKPRNHFKSLIENAGHKVIGSVSKKNTDYVLVGEDAGSKLDKAKELGISLIYENDLEKILSI